MTVYIVQSPHQTDRHTGRLVPKFDVSAAEKFGEIVWLLSPSARPFSPDHLLRELHEKLDTYDAEKDFILLIGNPTLIGFTVAIAAQHDPRGRVRVLQWSGKEYVEIVADVAIHESPVHEALRQMLKDFGGNMDLEQYAEFRALVD